MPKRAKPTLDPWTFDVLLAHYPRTAELFKASRYYSYHDSFDITRALDNFLDGQYFTTHIHPVARSKRINAVTVGYEANIRIKGEDVAIERRIFPHSEDARVYALGHVLDIFEEEQKIPA